MAGRDDHLSGEERLIANVFAPLATHPGALGLTDDCAVITPPEGCDLVLTTDTIIGGVHFFNNDAAHAVASKALRVNLSDLAAKGAAPLGFLLSLALPQDMSRDWLVEFAEGLRGDAQRYACPLLGGDTDRISGPITIAVSMFGSVPTGTMVRRAGAKPGDLIFVSGTIGDAALGLALRNDPARDWPLNPAQQQHLSDRYLLPQPRNALAEAVRTHASAAMDVSDGLVGDLTKLARVSQVARQCRSRACALVERRARADRGGTRISGPCAHRRRRLRDRLYRAAGQGRELQGRRQGRRRGGQRHRRDRGRRGRPLHRLRRRAAFLPPGFVQPFLTGAGQERPGAVIMRAKISMGETPCTM